MPNTYHFVRNELEDTYGLLKLQDKIAEIIIRGSAHKAKHLRSFTALYFAN